MLIARCALRDQAAFLALYDATSAKLFGVILRIVKREPWAEEVVQDVYLRIWDSAQRYNATLGQPMTWLINIARNRAIDFLRSSEYAMAHQNEELDDALPADVDLALSAETRAEMSRLAGCMDLLKSDQRDCILLVYHLGYTPTEVAERAGHAIGTVKTWLRRGVQRLRDCMRS